MLARLLLHAYNRKLEYIHLQSIRNGLEMSQDD